jgi:hypothetical protein
LRYIGTKKRRADAMTEDFDAPSGQPNPPFMERASPPIAWVLSIMLIAGLVAVVINYLGF